MDAIQQLPPELPAHASAPLAPVPHSTIAEWPEGTFLENLAVLPDGSVAISVLSEARIDRVTLQGAVATLRQFDAPPTGLAVVGGALFAAVGEPGAGPPTLWRLDPVTGDGEAWLELEGLEFANGLTPFAAGTLLTAESWQGRLVRIDLSARRASTWIEDERLTRAPMIDMLPGANGVKRWRDEVTVSSTGRALLLRAVVEPDGSAGRLEVVSEHLRVDDLAYDAEGRVYLSTHIGHSLDRLDRHGDRVMLAGPEQGLAGSTACAFHPDGGLYVTTTGGIILPPNGRLESARLVRLDPGAPGHPLESAWRADQ